MRIKKIQINNYYNIKEFICDFDKDENIINIVEPLESDNGEFFNKDGDFLSAIKMLFVNDSCNKIRIRVNKGTIIKCHIEHYEADFSWSIKGHTGRVETPEKIIYGDTVLWLSECINDKLEDRKYRRSLFRLNTQEFFYPEILRDKMLFDKNSKIYGVIIDDEILLIEYCRNKGVDINIEKEAENIFKEKEFVYVDEDTHLMFNEDYEYLLGYKKHLKYDLTEEQQVFLYLYNWIQRFKLIDNIFEKLEEESRYCVFIDGVLEKISNEKMVKLIIDELRNTARQVFVISHNKNEKISKFADKVVEINKIYR